MNNSDITIVKYYISDKLQSDINKANIITSDKHHSDITIVKYYICDHYPCETTLDHNTSQTLHLQPSSKVYLETNQTSACKQAR